MSDNEEEDERLDAMSRASINPYREIGLEELGDILGTTIKYDRGNKIITFLVMLGTYTDEEQSNILFRAESSTGKSYIPLEIARYFPENDIRKVSYASPTSFFHKFGEKKKTERFTEDKDGKQIKHSHTYYLVDMSRKIYIFKDMPSVVLLERLRSLLSHDEREMQIQFTNKTEKAGYRTTHIVIKGYPSVVFCTATSKVFDLQESTRFLVLSPDVETKKIKEAIMLLAKRRGNKKLFTATLNSDAKRHFLQQRVRNVKAENIADVIIPDEEQIAKDFIKSKKHLHPRHMRDFSRLLSLIKYWAVLNCWHRDKEEGEIGKIIHANQTDVEVGFILYKTICEANELGISPEIYRVYKVVLEPLDNGTGLTKEQISSGFLKIYNRPLGSRYLNKNILPNLLASGLIYEVEGTGVGGKPKIYRLSKYMEEKENGENIPNSQTILTKTIPQNNTQKLNLLLEIFGNGEVLRKQEIEMRIKGIINFKELDSLLNILYGEGQITMPDNYSYRRIF